jgi:hypothetical protein
MKRLWFVCIGCSLILLLGCQGIGKFEDNDMNVTSTVIYNSAGEPIQVLNENGQFISVNEASDRLLVERGLVRIEGKVVRQ